MIRTRLVVAFAAIALALVALGMRPSGAAVHARPRPTPTPLFLQYDQITRMVMGSGPAPAPGSFSDDYANIMSQAKKMQSSASAPHGMGGMLGSMMKGKIPGMAQAQMGMMMMRYGTLSRYTFFRNWVRTDDPVMQTAVISKCDLHETIYLNLKKHTYRIERGKPGCVQAPPSTPQMPGRPTASEQPGSADMTMTSKSTPLGPKMIEGIPTNGNRSKMAMSTTNATGSCRNSSFGMDVVAYISHIGKPRQYCPLPHTGPMQFSKNGATYGGCKMRIHHSGRMAGGMFNSRLLAMYRLSKMESGASNSGQGGGFGSLLERGHVDWLTLEQVKPLFEIPPGFTKER